MSSSGSSGSRGWDEYQALNFVDNVRRKHTVNKIKYIVDLAIIAKVDDMGHGILTVDVPMLPENDMERIEKNFRRLCYDPKIFADFNHSDIRIDRLNKLTVSKDDSFIGLFKCGDGEEDRYKIVVKSHSMRSSRIFQAGITKTLKQIKDTCSKGPGHFRSVCDSELNVKQFLEGEPYKNVIKRSLCHRLKLMKYIFDKCGISVPNRTTVNEQNKKPVIGPYKTPRVESSSHAAGIPGIRHGPTISSSSHYGGARTDDESNDSDINELEKAMATSYIPTNTFSSLWIGSTGKQRGVGGYISSGGLDSTRKGGHSSNARTAANSASKDRQDDIIEQLKHNKLYTSALNQYISLINNPESCRDYKIAFLQARPEDNSMWLFNHAYDRLSLHDGAPYFMLPQQGFYSYKTDAGSMRKAAVSLRHPACPLGVSFQRIEGTVPPSVAMGTGATQAQMAARERVVWMSQLDVSYLTNPVFYGDSAAEKEKVEEEFSLPPKSSFWRCCVTIYTPPDESSVPLDDFSAYVTGRTVHLPIDLWTSFFETYHHARQEWKYRINEYSVCMDSLAHFPPSTLRSAWADPEYTSVLDFSRFPNLTSIFSAHPRKRKLQAVYESSTRGLGDREMDHDDAKDKRKKWISEYDGDHMEVLSSDIKFVLDILYFFQDRSTPGVTTVEERGQLAYENAHYTESDSSDVDRYMKRDMPTSASSARMGNGSAASSSSLQGHTSGTYRYEAPMSNLYDVIGAGSKAGSRRMHGDAGIIGNGASDSDSHDAPPDANSNVSYDGNPLMAASLRNTDEIYTKAPSVPDPFTMKIKPSTEVVKKAADGGARFGLPGDNKGFVTQGAPPTAESTTTTLENSAPFSPDSERDISLVPDGDEEMD